MAAAYKAEPASNTPGRQRGRLAPSKPHAHNSNMPRRGASARPPQADPNAPPRPCDAPGCEAQGEFKAPRSRSKLNDYLWFCLPHVREYNLSWDYYKGMSPAEIEDNLRHDSGWHRPTWPLGRLGAARRLSPEALRDPLDILRDAPPQARRREAPAEKAVAPPELRAALDVLGLEWPVEHRAMRSRYKELAKRFHPDLNNGDRGAEEKLKDVNRAYSLLRQRLGAPRPAAASAATGAAAAP
jgi:DnaJ domain